MEVMVAPAASRRDEELSLAAYNAVWPLDALAISEVDAYKTTCVAYADYVAWIGGEPVGSGFAAVQPQRPRIVYAGITVLVPHRNSGTGTALYRAISGWSAALGLAVLEAPVPEDDEASLGFASRRGFVEVERNGRMMLDLGEVEPAPVAPPPGIEIVTWAERPDAARGMYTVAVEAYADVPGAEEEEMEPYEEWLAHDMSGPGDHREATFVALAGEEVIGYAKFSLTSARPRVAAHDMTGVKRSWRGRGIAGALKRAQIIWAKDQGYERLSTSNEMRNTPIRKLNARLGYRPAPGRVLMRGPLLTA